MSTTLQMRDTRLKTGRTGIAFRPAWKFKGPTTAFLRTRLETAPRPIIHLFSGSSELGDIKVDLFHPGADVKADAMALPFADGSAGTVLADPPWGRSSAFGFPERNKSWSETIRILRVGGRALLFAPYIPQTGKVMRFEGAWIRLQGLGSNPGPPVILSEWVKTRERGRPRQ